MKNRLFSLSILFALAVFLGGVLAQRAVAAFSFNGAIYTTFKDGIKVNGNIYTNKDDVYLNGGPQNKNSAGLPDGTYYFQVTEPPGNQQGQPVLLSTDNAECRQLVVAGGRISGVPAGDAPNGCGGQTPGVWHALGDFNQANNGTPVQLVPFNPTSNNGGEYKVWLISTVSECTTQASGVNLAWANNSCEKSDNFKVKERNTTCAPGVGVPPSCFADMPVNKTINRETATCTAIPAGDPPDPNGNANETRPCTFTNANLTLTALDPRFTISVYPTDTSEFLDPDCSPDPTDPNCHPHTADINNTPNPHFGLPFGFPSPGPKIPPQFDTLVPWAFHFTMCEAPSSPYTLTSVRIVSLPSNTVETPGIYFLSAPLFLDPPTNLIRNPLGGTYGCFNSVGPVAGTGEFRVTLDNSIICSYTLGGWGQTAKFDLLTGLGNVGSIRDAWFSTVYATNGAVLVGHTPLPTFSPSNYNVEFTIANEKRIEGFMRVATGLKTPGPLTTSFLDPNWATLKQPPSTYTAGTFGPQVLALELNVDFGAAGKLLLGGGGGGIGGFTVNTGTGTCENTKTVNDVLKDANDVLGGNGSSLPANCSSVSALNNLVDSLNRSFDSCVAGPNAGILTIPAPIN